MNQLFAQRYIVVGVLAVSTGAEIRFQKRICGQSARSGSRLKIPEMAEVTFVRILRVREIKPRHRIAVVAVDRPVDIRVRQASKDTRAGKNLHMIVKVALRSCRSRESTVGNGLRRCRREPLIADREALG